MAIAKSNYNERFLGSPFYNITTVEQLSFVILSTSLFFFTLSNISTFVCMAIEQCPSNKIFFFKPIEYIVY